MSTQHRSSSTPSRVFYGYWLVGFAFLCLTVCIGCGSFVFSLFVSPLQAELGWGRGEIMVGFTLFWLMMGVASPLFGRILDKHGARRAIPLGAVIMGFGFVVLSLMNGLPQFYLGYVLVGVGAAGIGPVPTSAIVSNWFKRKRGTTVGITSAGIGAGGVVMAPIVGYMLESYDWHAAYLAMAVIVWAAIIPLAFLLVRTRPEDVGLHPDGASHADEIPPGTAGNGLVWGFTLRQAALTLPFWLIALSYLFGNFSSMGGLQAQVPNLNDIGYPTATAAAALGAIGFGSAVGKVFFGWLCDRIQPRWASAIGLSLQCTAVLILLQVRPDSSMGLIWAYSLLMGFGAGSWLPTMSMLVSRSFGLAYYGSVFGIVNLAQSVGTAIGPLVAGVMFDSMGTYRWAFILFAALYGIAIPSVLLVRRPAAHLPA